MNTPTPPIDPLDPHERELARILRALPGGEPPPALDARILRAAHDALAQPAPRRRGLWAGGSTGALWGIGSAAAAVLAIGIGWKLTVPPDSALPVPRAMPVSTDSTVDQEATAVEFRPLPERRQDAAAAPPPPPAELKQEAPRRRVALPPPAPVAPAAAPAPAAPEPFPQAEGLGVASPAATAEADSAGLQEYAPAPGAAAEAGAAGRDARSAYSERQRDEALGRLSTDAAKSAAPAPAPATAIGNVGERELAAQATLADEDAASLRKRVEADASLAATAWLDRIRARARAGDTAGARASLRLFVARHPDRAVPTDLRPLLDE